MKTTLAMLMFLLLFCCDLLSQNIPTDSLYLAQNPPGNTPVIFELPINGNLRPVERIAISNDGTEIFFGQLNTYPPSVMKIKYFNYSNDQWQGPFDLFTGFMAPALSPNDSVMYVQASIDYYHAETYRSFRSASGWSTPVKMFSFDQQSHYCQTTTPGNCFISTDFPGSELRDLAQVVPGTDTSVVNIGLPISTSEDESDFFIARDESFIIHARHTPAYPGDLYVSYKKTAGGWTNSKPLGSQINIPNLWEYGPFVTQDDKYLFFTRGGASMSSYYTYWVKIDNILDSLKYTNYVPYVKNQIPDQDAIVDQYFSYSIPDSTFIDDDGNSTLAYSATLSNGNPLPGWLTFDSLSLTFSGTPTAVQLLNIKATVTDTAGATASATFKIDVHLANSTGQDEDHGLKIFPNPTRGQIKIELDVLPGTPTRVEIMTMMGKPVLSDTFTNEIHIDLSDKPKGMYIIKLSIDNEIIVRKVCLQ